MGVVTEAISRTPSPAVASLDGTLGALRNEDGAIMLVLLLLLAGVAALGWLGCPPASATTSRASRTPRWWAGRWSALGIVVLVTAGLVVGGLAREDLGVPVRPGQPVAAHQRVSSNRYEYCGIGARAFVHHPLDGLGCPASACTGCASGRSARACATCIRSSSRPRPSWASSDYSASGDAGRRGLGRPASAARQSRPSRRAHRRSGGVARARFDRLGTGSCRGHAPAVVLQGRSSRRRTAPRRLSRAGAGLRATRPTRWRRTAAARRGRCAG